MLADAGGGRARDGYRNLVVEPKWRDDSRSPTRAHKLVTRTQDPQHAALPPPITMSDLKTYLASKYGSGLKAEAILARADDGKRRKKKRKVDPSAVVVASGGGLVIADDDGAWGSKADESDEEAAPGSIPPSLLPHAGQALTGKRAVVEERRGHFKPASANSWATVRPADPSLARTPSPEPTDEAPVVVSSTSDAPAPARGGLQSVAQLRAENERRDAEQQKKKREAARELAVRKKEAKARGEDEDELEDPTATVYRDSSGRKIDVKLEKAAKAKEKRDEVEREMKKMEWGKGLVQKDDVARQKREQEEMKFKPLARCVVLGFVVGATGS